MRLLDPKPSLFDLCVAGLLFITVIPSQMISGLFFIFYSFFLICLGFLMKPKREYVSIPLVVLTIWSLIGVFIHYEEFLPKDTFINNYISLALSFDGFIHIFVGVMVLHTIVRYSTNLRFIYILLPGALLSFYVFMAYTGSMTPMMALLVSIVIYLFIKKRYVIGSFFVGVGGLIVGFNYKWLMMKFSCRPYVWKKLFMDMAVLDGEKKMLGYVIPDKIAKIIHPFIGHGFCDYLYGNMIWMGSDNGGYGYLWRHNDYLGLGAYLGVVALICVVIFTILTIKMVGKRPALIGVLTIAITCSLQMTMLRVDRAVVCLVVLALAIKDSFKDSKYIKLETV